MRPGLLEDSSGRLEAGVSGVPADGAAAGAGGVWDVVLSGPRVVKRPVLSPVSGLLYGLFDDASVVRVSVCSAGQREEGEGGRAVGGGAGHRKAAAVCTGGAMLLWFAAVGGGVFPAERAVSAPAWFFAALPPGKFLSADCTETGYRVTESIGTRRLWAAPWGGSRSF